MATFTQKSLEAGQRILVRRSSSSRKAHGQFLTPEPLAGFMAEQLGTIANGDRILDPAMGSGTLLCAIIDHLIKEGNPLEIRVDGFELDEELYATAQTVLRDAVAKAAEHGVIIHLNLFHADFVLNGVQFLRPSLLDTPVGRRRYQHIIANPPYFKINTDDARRQAAEGLLSGYTNIYTLFMGLAARMLDEGCACFIVPRSFCSGAYFKRFRRDFMERVDIQHVHLFEARDDAFSQDGVLQENLVIIFAQKNEVATESIEISSSSSLEGLDNGIYSRMISREQFISPSGLFRLPTSELDEAILDVVDSWSNSLATYGMEISTGPVVPFRAKQHLLDKPTNPTSVPLLWMQHIKPGQVTWPINGSFRKPQYMKCEPSLLVKNTNYVLLRRFSAKEEVRRLVAAPYIGEDYSFESVGLENHLNYIRCCDREMTEAEAIGLSALLNSGLIDRYFRISNGNTQVNATELRALPLPSLSVICEIGKTVMKEELVDMDEAVVRILQQNGLISLDIPILRETRVV